MQIFIKTLSGRTITIDISNLETILTLKEYIYCKDGTPIRLMRLYYGLIHLYDDDKTLGEYNITKESIIKISLNNEYLYTTSTPGIETNYNYHFNDFDLKNVNNQIRDLLDNKWKIEQIYRYKIEKYIVYRSFEKQCEYVSSYQKQRIQIGLENYIVLHRWSPL